MAKSLTLRFCWTCFLPDLLLLLLVADVWRENVRENQFLFCRGEGSTCLGVRHTLRKKGGNNTRVKGRSPQG